MITVYDGVDDTGNKLATIEPTGPVTLFYGITLVAGLFVVVSVAAADFDVVLADLDAPGTALLPLVEAYALAAVQTAVAEAVAALPVPSGSGALTLISAKVLAAPAASVEFTAIPGTFHHLKVVLIAASDFASVYDFPLCTINGDGGSNYDYEDTFTLGGATPGASSAASGTSFGNDHMLIAGATATANTPGTVEIDIPDYAGTVFNKLVKMVGGYTDVKKASADQSLATILGEWRSTAAVTDLAFTTANAANFIIGSAFYLYGVT